MGNIRNNKFLLFYGKYKLAINLFVIACLFLIHCFWGNMMYIAYPIVLLMVLLDNTRNGLTYVVFCAPFCKMNIYMSLTLYCVVAIAYLVKFYIILYFKDKTKPNILLLVMMGLFFVYALMPFGPYRGNLWAKVATLFMLFCVMGMVIKRPNIVRLSFNFRIIAIAILVCCLFSATYYISPYLQGDWIFAYAGERARYQALLGHPNTLAIFCEIIMSVLGYLIISKRAKWFDWVLLLSLTGVGIFTLSKTFLMLSIFIWLVIFIWLFTQNFLKTFVATCIVATIVVIVGCCFPHFVQIFINRFIGGFADCKTFADFMNIVTTYRYDLWVEYLTYFASNPFVLIFGAGLGAYPLSTLSSHNLIISGVYNLGIVGMILLTIVIVLMIREFLRNEDRRPSKAIWLPIVVLSLICMIEDLFFYIAV